MKNYKKIFLIRNLFKIAAFVFLLLAYLGIFWETSLVPVKKSSASVAFVFDVSNSMNARDCANGKSRLEAAAIYASKLLDKIQENRKTNVSVILSKGEGVHVIPLTEDYEIIYSLLKVLNSSLVSAPGTSLGKGITAAKNSFDSDFSSANKIWVFTDGEETDNQLADAMEDCVKSGISLSIIGFGSEKESEVLAGDRRTKIKTALRSDRIFDGIDTVEKKIPYFLNQNKIIYVNSEEKGSALKLLNQIIPSPANFGEKSDFVAYESQKVPRFRIFLVIAVLLYIFSFVFVEFDFSCFINKRMKKMSVLLVLTVICLVFTGCDKSKVQNDKKIVLQGLVAFQQKKYTHAVSYFMKAEEKAEDKNNSLVHDYAVYNLASTYIMQDEDAAATIKFQEISSQAPAILKYASFYNSGIVAYRNGDIERAADCFKKALEIDSSKIEAKVNLELALNQIEVKARQSESKLSGVSDDDSEFNEEESSIFEHIKENDQNQWKSMQTEQTQNLAEDY